MTCKDKIPAHSHEALNKLLTEQLFKVQDVQELNDPEKVSSTWVKHLYRLVDQLNDIEMQMTRMEPKDARKCPWSTERVILQKTHCLRTDSIIACCSMEKNMTTSAREPQIEYCLRGPTG